LYGKILFAVYVRSQWFKAFFPPHHHPVKNPAHRAGLLPKKKPV
jgi:hypothetical protein